MFNIIKKNLPYILIAGLLVGFYFWRYRIPPKLDISEMKLANTSGEQIFLKDLIQDSTVVHFYASWCGPCIHEMKEIRDEYADLKKSGIKFIVITDDNPATIKEMAARMPEDLDIYHIPSLQDAGIYTLPTTYFIHKNEMTHKQVDMIQWTDKQKLNTYFQK